jgi:DNA-directed RNA polymerase
MTANIIHSLDASHLINLINTAIELKLGSIISVHDCFGCLPNDLEGLSNLVKKEFIKLYTQSNFLELFHNLFLESLKNNQFIILKDVDNKLYVQPKRTKYYLPELPKTGNLNIDNIIHSKYMIT